MKSYFVLVLTLAGFYSSSSFAGGGPGPSYYHCSEHVTGEFGYFFEFTDTENGLQGLQKGMSTFFGKENSHHQPGGYGVYQIASVENKQSGLTITLSHVDWADYGAVKITYIGSPSTNQIALTINGVLQSPIQFHCYQWNSGD